MKKRRPLVATPQHNTLSPSSWLEFTLNSDIWCYWLVRNGWDLYFSANYLVMRWCPASDPMQLWLGLGFFSNDAFIRPVNCSPSVRPNDGWDLNLYDDDIAWGGGIIGSRLGGFGHLQGCGQNSSKTRVSAINYIPWKATTGWLQTNKAAIIDICIIWINTRQYFERGESQTLFEQRKQVKWWQPV